MNDLCTPFQPGRRKEMCTRTRVQVCVSAVADTMCFSGGVKDTHTQFTRHFLPVCLAQGCKCFTGTISFNPRTSSRAVGSGMNLQRRWQGLRKVLVQGHIVSGAEAGTPCHLSTAHSAFPSMPAAWQAQLGRTCCVCPEHVQ